MTDKISGTPCIVEQIEERKLGETFRARVSDNPNALVEPKILGIETFGNEGNSRTPSDKFKREARLCQNLSRD